MEKELESQTDWIVCKEIKLRYPMEEADVLSIQLCRKVMYKQDEKLRMLVLDSSYNVTTIDIICN